LSSRSLSTKANKNTILWLIVFRKLPICLRVAVGREVISQVVAQMTTERLSRTVRVLHDATTPCTRPLSATFSVPPMCHARKDRNPRNSATQAALDAALCISARRRLVRGPTSRARNGATGCASSNAMHRWRTPPAIAPPKSHNSMCGRTDR